LTREGGAAVLYLENVRESAGRKSSEYHDQQLKVTDADVPCLVLVLRKGESEKKILKKHQVVTLFPKKGGRRPTSRIEKGGGKERQRHADL